MHISIFGPPGRAMAGTDRGFDLENRPKECMAGAFDLTHAIQVKSPIHS